MRTILKVPVGVHTFNEAKQILDEAFEKKLCEIVAFANAHALNTAASNPAFREVLQGSITLNDGIGVNVASLLLFRRRFPENLNGTDFIPKYLRDTKNSYRIFLFGSKLAIVEKAAETLVKIAPQHSVAGYRDGYFHVSETHKIVEEIRNSKADILLVAMGNPAQELWLKNNLAATGCRLGFGVGALFDFLSEEVPRAPLWVRSVSLEWLYRLMLEPRRLWRRYGLGMSMFFVRIIGQRLSGARIRFGDSNWPMDYLSRRDKRKKDG